ncbi:hypothetical protein J4402_05525 [Candidatus Pacearchaeota archaeon]|nr:hypothetical protein [Candidatus Pacearchaeota archaeon]
METTIAVKERTVQMLLQLKKKMGSKNMDMVIGKLLEESGSLSKSRFGSNPKLKEFKRKDRSVFREL